jgi:AcrR family transcriptional regulator
MGDHVLKFRQRLEPPTGQNPPAATERGETTRRHILEVAAAAFADNGYAGTSLNDVIKDAGVTKGGFYFHFPSKEALALAVLRHKQEQWAGRVVSATMQQPRAIDQLRGMVEAVTALHEEDPSARAIDRLCLELSDDPALAPQMAPQFTTWIELASSLINKAQQEGDFRADVDPDVAAEIAVANFVGQASISKIASGGRDFRARTSRTAAFFLDMLGTDRG